MYASAVARRWSILVAIGLTVAVADQWTKLLAVQNLTPGFAIAKVGLAEARMLDAAGRQALIDGLGMTEKLTLFYGAVRSPCQDLGVYCGASKLIDGFWDFRYVENPGAAWGLFARTNDKLRVPFFLLVSIGAMGFILWYFRRISDEQRLLVFGLSFVFGGAIGNFVDRLHLSYVIDFIDWYVGASHWPTFNVADAAISTGVGLLILEMLLEKAPERAPAPSPDSPAPAEDR